MEQHDTQLLELFERFGGNKHGIERKKLINLTRQLRHGDRLLQLLPREPTFDEFKAALVTLLDEQGDHHNITLDNNHTLIDTNTDINTNTYTDGDNILVLWEKAGLTHPIQLLTHLGYNKDTVKLDDLAETLDHEARTTNDNTILKAAHILWKNRAKDRTTTLVRARTEIDGLKEQLSMAEKRAVLLARDVDESQAALVAASEAAIKKAEDKFAEEERKHRTELTIEKEKFASKLAELETALEESESEKTKLKNLLSTSETDNLRHFKNLETAKEEIKELTEIRKHLTLEMKKFGEDREKQLNEHVELRDVEIGSLRRENDCLSTSNKTLRDRVDELEYKIAEMENAPRPIESALLKENVPSDLELAAELNLVRPEKEVTRDFTITVPMKLYNIEDAAKDTKFLSTILRLSNVKHYYLLLLWLMKKILDDINIAFKSGSLSVESSELSPIEYFKRLCEDLLLVNFKNYLDRIRYDHSKLENLYSIDECDQAKNDFNGNENCIDTEFAEEKKLWDEEKNRLEKKCLELENSVEMLRNEYEKCEEYWSYKLEEERDIFDKEQRISDDKFAELLNKIAEYEEQFTGQDNKPGNLSTIEEKYNLEKQFTDLEDEFEEYKKKSGEELKCKIDEVTDLKEQISRLQEAKSIMQIKESAVQETNQNLLKESLNVDEQINNLINEKCHSEIADNSTNNNFKSPINYLWNQSTIPSPLIPNRNNTNITRDYQNPAFSKNDKRANVVASTETKIRPIQKPESAKAKECENTATKGKPKQFSKMLQCSELEESLRNRGRAGYFPAVKTPHQVIVANLEMKCMQLQCALRQQQMYTESLMRQTLVNHKSEIGELYQRLAAVDLLVRDLYVENCCLTSKLTNISP